MAGRLLVFFAAFGITPAFAHPPPLGVTGFTGGLIHPAFVPAHLLAIVALSILIGQQAGWGFKVALVFAGGLGAGLAIMTFGIVPRSMTEAVMALAVCAGLLIAWARPLSAIFGAGLAASIGFCVALDSPPETISVAEANRMLFGTGLGALALLAVCLWIARHLATFRSGIVARVAGSWIAASAILFLALRLAG
jgi:hydrogenase/urease accessory protein HupE